MPTPPRRTTATSAFGPIVPDAGYLVIYGLPYLDEEGRLTYGDLASTLDLNGAVIDPPTNNHQVWWRGRPFDQQKRQIRLGGGAHQLTVAADLVTDQSFSFKLQENGVNRDYRSFEEKVQTYLDAITAPAMAAYPEATPLRSGGFKVDALARQYGNWHAGLEPVPERITSANINRLAGFDFVFVSVDDGAARKLIVDWLSARGIPYVDCGMGLDRSLVGLSGFVRITGTDRKAYDDNVGSARLPVENTKENEYRKQAQITELNALNAVMAVVRFKQHFKLLDRLDEATSCIFDTATMEMD